MAYSTNPNLPKARALGTQLLVQDRLPVQTVANRCGVHRPTIWRWKQKWNMLNKHVQLENDNRPSRTAGAQFRFAALRWAVPTESSRPHSFPCAIADAVVNRILALRQELQRCAEVIWHHLVHDENIHVSLSSVRRKRVRPDNPVRPVVTAPGKLVETDTVHYICPLTKRRRYVYTVIDLYTRMAYAEVHDRIGPGIAARVVRRASTQFGFTFALVQADNGPEFGRHFEDCLRRNGTRTRHSRLHRPNDNAHIERFNRTIQEECLGNRLTYRARNKEIQARLTAYLDFYNTKRVHLGLQLRTPAEMLQRF